MTGALHTVVALAGTLLIAFLAGGIARRLGQPAIVGEIAAGLLLGPALFAIGGATTVDALFPRGVLDVLHLIGQAGLALFLLSVAHELKTGQGDGAMRRNGWLVAGALLPGLLVGALLAVLVFDDSALRGTAPAPALVVLLAIAFSVTAVPVLARILAERGGPVPEMGRLALGAAVAIDVVAWIGLAVAVGLASGQVSGFIRALAVLLGGAAVTVLLARTLRAERAGRVAGRSMAVTAVVTGAAALGAAVLSERWGMTAVFGVFVVGLALPKGGEGTHWSEVTRILGRLGKLVVPMFFVVTGLTVFTGSLAATPWWLIVVATVLAIVAKVGGGWLGGRLAGYPVWESVQFGVLMNTRGLTEIVLLQAGYSTGILPAPLFIALLLMALLTTASTAPALRLLDRLAASRGVALVPMLPMPPRIALRKGRMT
ncbi:cation:proton antiporter [Amycolatopsis sp. CA-230715]|uniref:cation:proton antiporter n=1 Tax=Amycolatopsis sp. CA-230715 TaxID=2745196 RepID=UPI001C0385B9|nr:cation:proton antiporter [Amycolatopsis sp. CA-230715]QWF84491.1 Na(+)/H(+)-K(+) antiporter GerN [Amycolatopsis sp. CA-230715]